ncbi:MAG: DUF364 domain-containing protein [Euryarchaeota archaeon]|nr:DUF364 domain-containing protein [Euryarchaeota archaeon]
MNNDQDVLHCLLCQIRHELGDSLSDVTVEDVRIGLEYTGVRLSGECGGVAFTPVSKSSECPVLHNAGRLVGKSVSDILQMSLSKNLLESVIGVAAINALAQRICELKPETYVFSKVDVLDLINAGDNVSMIGYFKPLVPKILRKTNSFYVIEKKDILDKRVTMVSFEEASSILPISDVILISASTLVNKTIDDLLRLNRCAREVVLLGPTASMMPQPFFEKGVTAVMGTRITDVEKMLKVVSEAGGTRQLLASCGEKVAFIRRDWENR